jgi:hypothetical protein
MTLYMGNQGEYKGRPPDPLSQRIYVKDTDFDALAGRRVKLPKSEHRARIELTLNGLALPFDSLDKVASPYCFTRHRVWFRFRMLKDFPTGPLVSLPTRIRTHLARESGQIGEERWRSVPKRSRRRFSTLTVSDEKLNAKVYEALRQLTYRFASSKRIRNATD